MRRSAEYLVPGDRVPHFADLDAGERDALLDELEANGLIVNRRGIVGFVSLCDECEGAGLDDRGHGCDACDSSGHVCDYGQGKRPFDE